MAPGAQQPWTAGDIIERIFLPYRFKVPGTKDRLRRYMAAVDRLRKCLDQQRLESSQAKRAVTDQQAIVNEQIAEIGRAIGISEARLRALTREAGAPPPPPRRPPSRRPALPPS